MKELQKRPFVRPLLVWITGIFLQTWFPLEKISFFILLVPAGFTLIGCSCKKERVALSYHARWVWGVLFSVLLLFLSIQVTFYIQQKGSLFSWELPYEPQANELKDQILSSLHELSLADKELAVLQTITFGEKQNLERETRQQFSITGVAHILAVSGFHVAIAGSFLGWLFFFLPSTGWSGRVKFFLVLVFFMDLCGVDRIVSFGCPGRLNALSLPHRPAIPERDRWL